MKHTEAMLDQRRLTLKYGLPQFIAVANPKPAEGRLPAINLAPPQQPAQPTPGQSQTRNWQIVGINSRVTATTSMWWRYAWKLILRNNSESPQQFAAEIEFQDVDGFVIYSGRAHGLFVPANEQVLTGSELVGIPGASRVSRTYAKVRKC